LALELIWRCQAALSGARQHQIFQPVRLQIRLLVVDRRPCLALEKRRVAWQR